MTRKLDTTAIETGRANPLGEHPPTPGRGVVRPLSMPPEGTPTREALSRLRFTLEELEQLRKIAGYGQKDTFELTNLPPKP